MKIFDFDANIYFLELHKVKEHNPEMDFKLWYRIDKIQGKFSKTFESVQGLIKKINSDIPDILPNDLKVHLLEALNDSNKEYTIEKIPFYLLDGIKGNWNVLKQLIEMPAEEVDEVKESKPE